MEVYQSIGNRLQEDLMSIELAMKIKTITSITSETLVYRADMSLFSGVESR
jgi:hypothetical protein